MAKRHSPLSPLRDWRMALPKGYVRLPEDATRMGAERPAVPPPPPNPDLEQRAGGLMVTRAPGEMKNAGKLVLYYLVRASQNRSGMAPVLHGRKVQPKRNIRVVGERKTYR